MKLLNRHEKQTGTQVPVKHSLPRDIRRTLKPDGSCSIGVYRHDTMTAQKLIGKFVSLSLGGAVAQT